MIRNTSEHWGWPARALHWLIALLILGLYAFGLWMTDVEPRSERYFYFAIHASIGITILALMVTRFLWWLANDAPVAPVETPAWQRMAARVSHWLLYALTFATALVGWLLSGTMRQPIDVKLFGIAPVPPLIEGRTYHRVLEDAHGLLANTLIVLVIVHAGAALYHHFVLRDAVLRRMLGSRPQRQDR